MQFTSNLSEITGKLKALAGALNLSRARSSGRTLGEKMADVVAAGIRSRTLDKQESPDGTTLPANRGRYGDAKRNEGVQVGVGLYGSASDGYNVGGEMLEFEQLRGQVAIGPNDMEQEYGLDQEMKQEMDWFSTGNSEKNQPPRPVYQLDSGITRDIDGLAQESIDDTIAELGGD